MHKRLWVKIESMLDPVTVELIKNQLNSSAEQMRRAIIRTSYDPVIFEFQDFGLGLLDKNFEPLTEASGLSVFTGILSEGTQRAIEASGLENLEQGDILVTNWPYWSGSHVNDVNLSSPIFYGSELVGYASSIAHWIDIGQREAAYCLDTMDVYQEGVKFPGVKLFKRGEIDPELERILRFNCRAPDRLMGNIHAQIAAIQTGVRSVRRIAEKYGKEILQESMVEILEYGEKTARQELEKMPKGTWTASDYMDPSAVNPDVPIKLQATVTITESDFIIDYTGSNEPVKGPTNAPLGMTKASGKVVFKALTTPFEPANGGNFRPLKFVVPEDSVLNAKPPTACFLPWPGFIIMNVVLKALAQVMPDKIGASNAGDQCSFIATGVDTYYERFWLYVDTIGVGYGGRSNSDGETALMHDITPQARSGPAEVQETMCPLIMERSEIRQDSCGAGKYRGGLGIRCDVRFLSPTNVLCIHDRMWSPPWGLFGGKPADPNHVIIFPDTEKAKKVGRFQSDLIAGEKVSINSGGGGGWGDPLERDPELVRKDVEYGYISLKKAQAEWGVIMNSSNLDLDIEATIQLRAQMQSNTKV